MDPSLQTSASGMTAQQTRVDVIANNLANVNTTGFKRSRPHFEDLLYQTVQEAQTVDRQQDGTLPAMEIGRGTRLSAVQRMDGQGPLEQTGRALDLAVEGNGYFQVQMPDGSTEYTRDGSFSISDQGAIVTTDGYTVVPGIVIPPDATNVSISETGVVSAHTPNSTQPTELGRIELAQFANPEGLRAMGQNLYAETSASGQPVTGAAQQQGFGRILQGSLEASNVQIVQEMVDMISALRAYEINSKAVQTSEQMSQMTNALLR